MQNAQRRTHANLGAYTLTVEEPYRIGFQSIEEAPLGANEVRIKTLYSGISAGTEMTAFLGTNPYLQKRWNPDKKLFEDGEASMNYPMPAIGYEEVGEITSIGKDVRGLTVGQLVWGAWGHKSSHTAPANWAAERLLPEGLDPVKGIYSQIGAIALNAVLDSNVHIGEQVAVFGQGVPGLMVTQLLKASGAEVIAVDRLAKRLDAAKASGADHLVNGSETDPAETIKKITGGRGADVSIEITGSYFALHDAIRSTAYNSRVVVSGFFQGDGKGLRLGEEFHHNRIDLVCSQIYGLNPSIDHRWDRMRLDQTIMKLQAQGKIDFKKLISHTFKAADAQAAFDLLRHTPNDALQIVLDFTE
jgi:2-desacetyl-2-hydroxyethyl bacteriochlorophyllide A dehydrogenase